tara:strand:- start:79 stop:441 length:363 start_codon:yes stop_codon:yes gene_type:complete
MVKLVKLNKKNKNYIFLGVGGILVIVVSLFIFKKDRLDEYSCIFSDGSGPIYLTIDNDNIIENKTTMKISKETSEKIVVLRYPKTNYGSSHTFFKRTNKYVKRYKSGEKSTFVLDCTQLN